MKIAYFSVLLLILSLPAPCHADDFRTFTDTQGRSMRAKVVSIDGDKVKLRRADLRTFSVSPTIFSAEDQAYLAAWGKEEEEQADAPDGLDPEIQLGEMLFEETFEDGLNEETWRILDKYATAFRVEEGVLIGKELPAAGHGSTMRAQIDRPDLVVSFDFTFNGCKNFNWVLDDMACKSVHAGHITRVAFRQGRGFTIQDNKTGNMNLSIREEIKSDPGTRQKYEKLFETKQVSADVDLEVGETYTALIVKKGDKLTCTVDGVEATLQSEGIAHPALSQFGPTITGGNLHLDNIRVWAIE